MIGRRLTLGLALTAFFVFLVGIFVFFHAFIFLVCWSVRRRWIVAVRRGQGGVNLFVLQASHGEFGHRTVSSCAVRANSALAVLYRAGVVAGARTLWLVA